MYRADDLKEGLLHLWGWRQNYDTGNYSIEDALLESDTGRYLQEVHPLLTLDNLKAIAPDFDNMETTDATFSDWLEEKMEGGIMQAIQTFYDTKISGKTLKSILERKTLFDGAGRLQDTITNQGKIVGFEIVPIRALGVTVKVNRIGLQFTKAGTVTLYLMHSSRKEVIKTIVCTRVKAYGQEWFTPDTDLYLPYLGDETDAGGSWYLVYAQDELPEDSEAINKAKDWSKSPCSCSPTELSAWKVWSRYMEVHPFSVAGLSEVSELWDIEDNLYTSSYNYGMNLQITIECDLTDFILEQKKSFQNLIGFQIAINLLREMAYNPAFKLGRPQQNLSMQSILYELDGDSQSPKMSGLVYQFNKALEAVNLDMAGLSRVCLPCRKGGIKYRTV